MVVPRYRSAAQDDARTSRHRARAGGRMTRNARRYRRWPMVSAALGPPVIISREITGSKMLRVGGAPTVTLTRIVGIAAMSSNRSRNAVGLVNCLILRRNSSGLVRSRRACPTAFCAIFRIVAGLGHCMPRCPLQGELGKGSKRGTSNRPKIVICRSAPVRAGMTSVSVGSAPRGHRAGTTRTSAATTKAGCDRAGRLHAARSRRRYGRRRTSRSRAAVAR
jgi:hypothetical protein